MKNYTITVNGNVYDVTVEEKGTGTSPAAPAPAPKAAPAAPAKKPAPAPAPAAAAAGSIEVKAGAAGKVFKIEAGVGTSVKRGDAVVIIEAMKMMSEVPAPCDCVIETVCKADGELVAFGEPLFRYKPC